MRALVVFLLVGVSTICFANEELKNRESISEKARARLYDGGLDEQPLTVQQSLIEPRTDGSEALLQKKILNSDEDASESNDETSSGF